MIIINVMIVEITPAVSVLLFTNYAQMIDAANLTFTVAQFRYGLRYLDIENGIRVLKCVELTL